MSDILYPMGVNSLYVVGQNRVATVLSAGKINHAVEDDSHHPAAMVLTGRARNTVGR